MHVFIILLLLLLIVAGSGGGVSRRGVAKCVAPTRAAAGRGGRGGGSCAFDFWTTIQLLFDFYDL